MITVIVTNYINEDKINFEIEYINIGDNLNDIIYIINITNNSSHEISDLKLIANVKSQVYNSIFDGFNTTHYNDELLKLYSLCDTVKISHSYINKIQFYPNEYIFRNHRSIKRQISNNNSSEYCLSLGRFNLRKFETKKASIYVKTNIANNDFKIISNNRTFYPDELREISNETISEVINVFNKPNEINTNRVYAIGLGLSNLSTISQAKIESRNLALKDLEVSIAKKLYGVEIEAVDKVYMSEEIYNIDSSYSKEIYSSEIKTNVNGHIDEQSIFIYSERFNVNDFGQVECELKAYYSLPWKVKRVNQSQYYNSEIRNDVYTTRGGMPNWYLNPPIDNFSMMGTGCGKASSNLLSFRVASSTAMADIARQLEFKVKSYFKSKNDFNRDIDELENGLTMSDIESYISHEIKNAYIIKRHLADDGNAYVLMCLDLDSDFDSSFEALLKEIEKLEKK